MVVVYAGRTRRRSCRAGRIVVVHSLLRPEQENRALHRWKPQQRRRKPGLDVRCDELGCRIGVVRHVVSVKGEHRPALALPEPVAENVGADPEEPPPKAAFAPPALDPTERAEEGVLEDVLDILLAAPSATR